VSDLDLRKLRYFVAVADGLHFGRAAEELYIAQSVLSRQIRRLERDLGADLLVRSSRRVELTEAGRQLLEEARPLLAAADVARRRVQDAAQGVRRLTVGFFIGDPISRLVVRAFRAAHPDVTVDAVRIYWHDQPRALLDGRVDVALVHLPIDEEGLALVRLDRSPKVALLPSSHPLADRDEIRVTDVADEPMVRHRGASPTWEAWHNADPRPDGRRARSGPVIDNFEEKLEVVGTGQAISFVPVCVAAAVQMPPDVVAIPIIDVPPVAICLAWKADRHRTTITAFAETARTVLTNAARFAA